MKDVIVLTDYEKSNAETIADSIKHSVDERERLRIYECIERSLKLHRFMVFSWLLRNGVQIPTELVSDITHETKTIN